jgi:cytochrome c-type biogenesis protein CcmH/NrfG
MKKKFINIAVLMIFSASIILGCVPAKAKKDQSLESEDTKKITEPSVSYEVLEEKLKELNTLLKKGLITEDEYYKTRARLLEEF